MTPQQQAWSAGDFSKVGVSGVIVGELLCESVGLRAGQRVLDVATGAGNTAIAAARRATEVTGVDFVPHLLERARERAQVEGLHRITFVEGPNDALPFPDRSFDVVLSTFGHMFTPDPARAAAEMVRVARPGGRIGFAAWTPEGFNGQMFRINAKYSPPPPGVPPPVQWGVEDVVRERLGSYATEFQFTKRNLIFRAATPEDWLAHMREFFGPMRLLWEKLDDQRRADLTNDLLALITQHNQSGDRTMLVPGEYLEAVIALH